MEPFASIEAGLNRAPEVEMHGLGTHLAEIFGRKPISSKAWTEILDRLDTRHGEQGSALPAPVHTGQIPTDRLLEETAEDPLARLVYLLLVDATNRGARRIIIDSAPDRCLVRLSIDGLARELPRPSANLGARMLDQLLSMCGRLVPMGAGQLGRFRLDLGKGRALQAWTSVSPTLNGRHCEVELSLKPKRAG